MKRTFILFLLAGIMTNNIHAQLYVDSNGNVGIKVENGPIRSAISINEKGYAENCASIYAYADSCDTGLRISKVGTPNTNNNYIAGIRSYTRAEINSQRKSYGILSQVYKTSSTETNQGRSYGFYGLGGNATPGWNYGVFGTLHGNNNGAGVFGSSESWDGGVNTAGRFAGYFNGKVKVVGEMMASSYTTTSDFRLKENISQIDDGSLNKVKGMNVIKYRLKNLELDMGDTAKKIYYMYPEDSPILKKDHFGLIAQELKEIYPELVDEGEDGYLSVNYMELVPILIKSIQELSSKFDALENEAAKSIQRGDKNTMIGGLNLQAILYQNDPNPFTENTTIKCVIPNSVQNAVLYIYDMNGHQIDSRTIAERGIASLTIEGSSLDAGMYLYSLITDGTVVDTKRMILTK